MERKVSDHARSSEEDECLQLLPMTAGQERDNIAWLADIIISTDESLRLKYGASYWYYLETATSLIETTCRQEQLNSPIIAAVKLGVTGRFTGLVGNENDAFKLLLQAAIRILLQAPDSSRLPNNGESVN